MRFDNIDGHGSTASVVLQLFVAGKELERRVDALESAAEKTELESKPESKIPEIADCPFCGSRNFSLLPFDNTTSSNVEDGLRYVRCFSCGARGPAYRADQAIHEWGRVGRK